MVLDNSDDDRRASDIQGVAHAHGIAYVRLPPNAWNGSDVAPALALAMNWAWRHLILPGEPKAFGFIDHDIYPVRRTDPFAPLQTYPVAGRVWHRLSRWHLWAGYCFFRFDAVRHTRLDFGRDFLAAMDTGGRNWWRFYRYLNAAKVQDPGVRAEAILAGYSVDECAVEWLGDWLHESHHRNSRRDLQSEKEHAVRQLLLSLEPLRSQGLLA